MTAYFKKYGQSVADNGYKIIPIRPGYKAPLGLDWTAKGGDSDDVRGWLANGYTHEFWSNKVARERGTRTWPINAYGVGILAAVTPLVDVDVLDPVVSAHMVEFTQALLGPTIVRVGMAPKTGLVYRAAAPFAKVNSGRYLDGEGRIAKLEVLGAGQQFVALAVHPDTNEPYRWIDKKGVHNTPVDDLPEITLDDARAIRDEFDRIAKSRGWEVVKDVMRLEGPSGPADADDPFADVAPKVVGVSDDEMRRLTMLVPGADNYETWTEIGMALFHQFDGSDEGLSIWDEWSSESAKYSAGEVSSKWASFDIDGKRRQPLTARVILERSKVAEAERLVKKVDEAIEAIMLSKTADELTLACKPYKSMAFTDATRNMLVGKLRERYKTVTNTPLPVADARKMLRYEDSERVGRYAWLTGYTYVQLEDAFYNVKTGALLSPRAFDGSYSRYLLSPVDIQEGKSSPDHLPQHIARNVVQIPIVSNRMYMPGLGDVFSINGEDFANRFTERSIPEAAEEWTVAGRAAVEKVEAHAVHMFSNDRDRGLFLDFLAYIVQTNDRPNWGVFVQGVGGDGKTFWGDLMTAVLGMRNSTVIRGAELKEKFTGWAEGHLFCMVEEVRLTGEHRYDAINNLKPYITNKRVTIRRMNMDSYPIINRTAYLLTSNFKDGLPASEGDRYMILFSRWQDEEKTAAWKAANSHYFVELWSALQEAPSIRKWLLERRLSPEFKPKDRAPGTSDLLEMKHLVADDESLAIKRVLDDGNDADFSRALLDSSLLSERMTGSGAAAPVGRRMSQLLSKQGMTWIGETGFGGKTRRWWSNEPERFTVLRSDGKTVISPELVQQHLDQWL